MPASPAALRDPAAVPPGIFVLGALGSLGSPSPRSQLHTGIAENVDSFKVTLYEWILSRTPSEGLLVWRRRPTVNVFSYTPSASQGCNSASLSLRCTIRAPSMPLRHPDLVTPISRSPTDDCGRASNTFSSALACRAIVIQLFRLAIGSSDNMIEGMHHLLLPGLTIVCAGSAGLLLLAALLGRNQWG